MEKITPEIIALGVSTLCCLTPALILLGKKLINRKPKHTWDIDTIQGLEEANFTPSDIRKFLGSNGVRPAKKLPKIRS